MSAAQAILDDLVRRGVVVRVDGDALVLKPRSALDDPLLDRVRAAKPAILETLRNRPATCAASCYEVEPGRWIHHPWDGCATPMPPQSEGRKVEAVCWHCAGVRRCGCSTCWQAGPGPCVTCQGTGQVWRWIQ